MEWISVKNKLPKKHETVIGCVTRVDDNYTYANELIYNPNIDTWEWYDDYYVDEEMFKITHWMPMPELPIKEKE